MNGPSLAPKKGPVSLGVGKPIILPLEKQKTNLNLSIISRRIIDAHLDLSNGNRGNHFKMASNPPEPPQYHPIKMIRKTKGGRSLRYELGVLQEPERARACGSGAKCKHQRILL